MLNLQFIYLLVFFLPFLIFINNITLIIINYFFYIKTFLYVQLKTKKKKQFVEIVNLDVYNSLLFIILINFIFLNFKFSNYIFCDYKNFQFYKFSFFIFIFLSILINILNFFFKYFYNSNYTINYNSYIGINFLILIFFSLFTTNFLIFFFLIELFGYLFYLQFLQIFDKIKTKKISNFYLDTLLLYYWLNFFASVLMLYFIIYLFSEFNTINFIELNFFINKKQFIYIIFFLGFSIKMGLPGFHFFKIEIYKNLKLDSIINFSFYSLFGYIILIKYLTLCMFFQFNFFNFFIIFLLIFFLLFVSQTFFKLNNIVLFFGYSTILNTILLLFLIF